MQAAFYLLINRSPCFSPWIHIIGNWNRFSYLVPNCLVKFLQSTECTLLCAPRASLTSREICEHVKNVSTCRIKALICKMILNKKNRHKLVIYLLKTMVIAQVNVNSIDWLLTRGVEVINMTMYKSCHKFFWFLATAAGI